MSYTNYAPAHFGHASPGVEQLFAYVHYGSPMERQKLVEYAKMMAQIRVSHQGHENMVHEHHNMPSAGHGPHMDPMHGMQTPPHMDPIHGMQSPGMMGHHPVCPCGACKAMRLIYRMDRGVINGKRFFHRLFSGPSWYRDKYGYLHPPLGGMLWKPMAPMAHMAHMAPMAPVH